MPAVVWSTKKRVVDTTVDKFLRSPTIRKSCRVESTSTSRDVNLIGVLGLMLTDCCPAFSAEISPTMKLRLSNLNYWAPEARDLIESRPDHYLCEIPFDNLTHNVVCVTPGTGNALGLLDLLSISSALSDRAWLSGRATAPHLWGMALDTGSPWTVVHTHTQTQVRLTVSVCAAGAIRLPINQLSVDSVESCIQKCVSVWTEIVPLSGPVNSNGKLR